MCQREWRLKGKYKVVAISDISVVDSTSPYVQWIESVVEDLNSNSKSKDIFVVDVKTDLKEINYNSLLEYAPQNIVYAPLNSIKENSDVNYIFLLFKQTPWLENEILMLKHLCSSLAYFLFAMRSCGILQTIKKISLKNRYYSPNKQS